MERTVWQTLTVGPMKCKPSANIPQSCINAT
jgi:hypothetical protein